MKTPERLAPILQDVAARAAERRVIRPLSSLRQDVQIDATRIGEFTGALEGPGISFITECKRRAPSAGELSKEISLAARIQSYAAGGAHALSILTEGDHFGGSLADLAAAPDVKLPRLRKDFILDEAMVLEAQLAGAHGILLIAACLPPTQLAELRQAARENGLAVLLEVHTHAELEIAIPLQPDAMGVNSRNLTTFETDLALSEELLPLIPEGLLRVAESGLHQLEDIRRMRSAGAHAVLIGTALMRSSNPVQTIAEWRQALDA